VPSQGNPLVLRHGNIHSSIQRDLKPESGSSPDVSNAETRFTPLLQLHHPHTGNLQKMPDPFLYFLATVVLAKE
jgi:hypothetical protein